MRNLLIMAALIVVIIAPYLGIFWIRRLHKDLEHRHELLKATDSRRQAEFERLSRAQRSVPKS